MATADVSDLYFSSGASSTGYKRFIDAQAWLAQNSSTTEIYTEFPFGSTRRYVRIVPTAASVPWVRQVTSQMERLLSLPPNWDHRGASAVKVEALQLVAYLLQRYMRQNTAAPQLVPTREGGVQLEWHQKGIDLEIRVSASGQVEVVLEDSRTGAEWDGPLTNGSNLVEQSIAAL